MIVCIDCGRVLTTTENTGGFKPCPIPRSCRHYRTIGDQAAPDQAPGK